MITGMFIGIVIWTSATILVDLLTKNDDLALAFGLGPVVWMCLLIKHCRKVWRDWYYRAILIKDGQFYNCHTKDKWDIIDDYNSEYDLARWQDGAKEGWKFTSVKTDCPIENNPSMSCVKPKIWKKYPDVTP